MAEKLLGFINDKKLPLSKFLSISSDGSNINKAILQKLNKELADAKMPLLIKICTCTLHTIHNTFGKSLASFRHDAKDLALKLLHYFKHSAALREDYRLVQVELELNEVFFIRHIPNRWLSLKPALERILSQWSVITAYFN